MKMEPVYNLTFVVLSILVAMLASYVALHFSRPLLKAKGRAKFLWLSLGSIAMGMGIWSMHFIGMEAFGMPGMQMAYDIPLMTLSVLIAIFASGIALEVIGRPNVTIKMISVSGIAMAAAIAGMHYTGMYSMRMPAVIEWNPWLVSLSVVIALVASFAALFISIRLRENNVRYRKPVAAAIMGFAISGMHYTGMFAATFYHAGDIQIGDSNFIASDALGIAILVATFLILGLALLGSAMDRILTAKIKKAEEVETLLNQAKHAISQLEEERALRERFVSRSGP